MAGLQDMAPMVESLWVTSAVRAPMRAEAAAASAPAWPPPTTITSNTALMLSPTGTSDRQQSPLRSQSDARLS